MRLDVFLHVDNGQLDRIEHALSLLLTKGNQIMATVQDLATAVSALKDVVNTFPGIVDGLEARITAALASAGITPEVQALVDQAFADATSALTTAQAAAADALDGVDEAAAPPAPPAP